MKPLNVMRLGGKYYIYRQSKGMFGSQRQYLRNHKREVIWKKYDSCDIYFNYEDFAFKTLEGVIKAMKIVHEDHKASCDFYKEEQQFKKYHEKTEGIEIRLDKLDDEAYISSLKMKLEDRDPV